MSTFNLESSIQKAQQRLRHTRLSTRKKRSDRGKLRLHRGIQSYLNKQLAGHVRPAMKQVLRNLRNHCLQKNLRCPSRAFVYQYLRKIELPRVRVNALPRPVQQALYNFANYSVVPQHQLAFYCLNYGDISAISFAAGLPWLALYQAARMRGWRPKSRGLLRAIMKTRNI